MSFMISFVLYKPDAHNSTARVLVGVMCFQCNITALTRQVTYLKRVCSKAFIGCRSGAARDGVPLVPLRRDVAALSAVCMPKTSLWAGFARLSGGVGGAGLGAAAGLPELKSGLALKRAGTLLAVLAREKRPTPGRGDSSLAVWNENPGLCSAEGRADVEGAPAFASSAQKPAVIEADWRNAAAPLW